MKKPQIWEPALPEISINDIYQAEGADYSKRSPSPSMVRLHQLMLEEATGLIRPTVIMREVEVVGKDEQHLYLQDGKKLTSKLLVKSAGTAEKLLLLAMTMGKSLEDRVSNYTKEGKILESFIIDAAGTAFIAKGSKLALGKMQESYKQAGMKTTFPMGPGHSYWNKLEDIQVIFHFLKAEKAGLALNDSNLIIPRKSIAFVMGIGPELPDHQDKVHCDFCSIKSSCHMRQCC